MFNGLGLLTIFNMNTTDEEKSSVMSMFMLDRLDWPKSIMSDKSDFFNDVFALLSKLIDVVDLGETFDGVSKVEVGDVVVP